MRPALVALLAAALVLLTPSSDLAAPQDRIPEPATTVAAIGSWHAREIGFTAKEAPRPKPKPSRSQDRISPSGSPKAYARALVGSAQFGCLDRLWERESGWNPHADNPSSSAYGIPQALPGSKMASAGADWASNPQTQIRWGLGYIRSRYGTPCGAWAHSQSHGWY